jgi:hypothetical protein
VLTGAVLLLGESEDMMFPDRVRSIRPSDRVLEVGPGGIPFHRADFFLEVLFHNPQTAERQRGLMPAPQLAKPPVYFDGCSFPMRDGSFDYVVCSHVLEHVRDVGTFTAELSRVASRGYVEFPTVYYDYLYDFEEHVSLLFLRGDTIYWMPKADLGLASFRPITRFYYETLKRGYDSLVTDLRPHMFQGFEWTGELRAQRARGLEDLVLDSSAIATITPTRAPKRRTGRDLWTRIRLRLSRRAS